MADIKISDMTAGASLTGAEVVPIVQSGANRRTTAQAIANLSGLGAVTAHTGTSWDGTPKYRELTGNLALTLSTSERSGFFIFKQDATGGRTLTINGTSVAIASGANAYTVVAFTYNDVTSTYVISFDTDIVGNISGGDLTAPTVSGIAIENADPSTIVITYNEALDGGSQPATTAYAILKNGGSVAASGVVVSGSEVEVGLSTPAISTDVFTIAYTAPGVNPVQDVAGNDAASFGATAVSNNVSGGGGYDADAQNVITAIEATGPTLTTGEKDAIDGLVVDLKAAGLWTGMEGLYGYVGGTAAAHAINWKTPGTFNITWGGGITHSATGVLFNGTTGYGDTGINDNTHLTLNDVTFGAYSRSNTNNGFAMGVHENGVGSIYMADSAAGITVRTHTGADFTSGATTPTRLMVAARQTPAPAVAIYRDGTQLSVDNAATLGKANGNVHVGAFYNVTAAAVQGFSDKEYALHFIYDGGMDATDVTALTTAVNTFQTALGRNV